MRVRAVVHRTKQKSYTLALSVHAHDYRMERSLQSVSCKSVADAAAWFIAMARDPSVSDSPADAQQSTAAVEPPTTSIAESECGSDRHHRADHRQA